MAHTVVKEAWKSIQADLQGAVGEKSFRMFLKNTLVVELNERVAEIGVPNLIVADFLQERYAKDILDAIERTVGYRPATIKLSVNGHLFRRLRESQRDPDAPLTTAGVAVDDTAVASSPAVPASGTAPEAVPAKAPGGKTSGGKKAGQRSQIFNLNDRYRLDSFVVGAANKFAFNCAVDVARAPGKKFNPLFIYGGCGLGKTHLLQGIARTVEEAHPELRVLYVPAEYFVNQFIQALRANTLDAFRERFRKLDVLIVDDINFFAGKAKSQDEFLHTLSALETSNKQIVLASDLHPKELTDLTATLRSRFVQGVIAELKVPNAQMRVSIIKSKISGHRDLFPESTIAFLANKLECNVRELEGWITQLIALASINNERLTVSLVQVALTDFLARQRRTVELADIENVVIAHYGVSSADLHGKSRERTIATARQMCMYLARNLTQHSLKEIGSFFGNKNHSTVVFATQKVARLIQDNLEEKAIAQQLERQLTQQA